MNRSVKDTIIRLSVLAITMIPYRRKKENGTVVCQSLLFRYEYDPSKKPALKLQKNK